MQSYINKFNIAINGNRSEVLINFSQAVPQIPSQVTSSAEPTEVPVEIIPVANLVMTEEVARNLLQMLQDILKDPSGE